MFRSEKMNYYEIIIPKESAWEMVREFGSVDCVHFVDENREIPFFSRPYINYMRRCEDIEIKIRAIRNIIKEFNMIILPIDPAMPISAVFEDIREYLNENQKPEHTYIDEIETEIDKKHHDLTYSVDMFTKNKEKINHFQLHLIVLETVKEFLGKEFSYSAAVSDSFKEDKLIETPMENSINFNYCAGVVRSSMAQRLKKMVFRATRGNCFINFRSIPHEKTAEMHSLNKNMEDKFELSVFFILYQSGDQSRVKGKLHKIIEALEGLRFDIPENPTAFAQISEQIKKELASIEVIHLKTREQIIQMLREFTMSRDGLKVSVIDDMHMFTVREKSIYHHFNLMKYQENYFHAKVWVPENEEDNLHSTIAKLNSPRSGLTGAGIIINKLDIGEAIQVPPTLFRLNEFTGPWQEIVNAYGIPRYQEVNPGYFTCLSFPWLFGIMFGDVLHGSIYTIFGLILIYFEDKLRYHSSLRVLYDVRFMILFCGIFAFFMGSLYNDMTSLPLGIFNSCFVLEDDGVTQTFTRISEDCVYPWGFDPRWYNCKNDLTFFNSFKMKFAVIVGVSQMILGIFMKGVNDFYFKQKLGFIFEFIPQLLFMMATFGYMCFLIYLKWALPWPDTSAAPSILTLFINLGLKGGAVDGQGPLWGNLDQQEYIQKILVLIAFVSVPLMLLVKPTIIVLTKEKKKEDSALQIEEEKDLKEKLIKKKKVAVHIEHAAHPDHDDSVGELFIHQMIETIEFVLGTISHTASYLRLWALSLAHSQLCDVFYNKCVGDNMKAGNIILTYIGFFIFFNATLGVLLSMDVMECFLHDLRLHWVEFQSKFFKGDGYQFKPLSFKNAVIDARNHETQLQLNKGHENQQTQQSLVLFNEKKKKNE